MAHLTKASLAIALCTTVASVAAFPGASDAGVMSIADKATVSSPAPMQKVDWRRYQHRHHRWHYGWHYGYPRYRYGYYAGWNPAYAPPAGRGAYGYGYGSYGYAPGYGTNSWAANPLGALFGVTADVVTSPVWATEEALGYPAYPPYRW